MLNRHELVSHERRSRPVRGAYNSAIIAAPSAPPGELAMDRNRILLIGGALALALFLAFLFAPGGVLPR
jgi:hypothetical protein